MGARAVTAGLVAPEVRAPAAVEAEMEVVAMAH